MREGKGIVSHRVRKEERKMDGRKKRRNNGNMGEIQGEKKLQYQCFQVRTYTSTKKEGG